MKVKKGNENMHPLQSDNSSEQNINNQAYDRVLEEMNVHGEENEDVGTNSPYPEVPLSPSPKESKPLSPSKHTEERENRMGLPR